PSAAEFRVAGGQPGRAAFGERAEEAQPGDAAVREDVDPDLVGAYGLRQDEAVVGVGLEPGPGQELGPLAGLRVAGRQPRPAGRVPLEVRGVDLDGADVRLFDEVVVNPVVAPVAPAAGLPAVVHLAGAAGLDGVGRRGVEAVGGVLD